VASRSYHCKVDVGNANCVAVVNARVMCSALSAPLPKDYGLTVAVLYQYTNVAI
jgi:hypothetical protein